jgi:hypothetical protein
VGCDIGDLAIDVSRRRLTEAAIPFELVDDVPRRHAREARFQAP